jgi:hypothetical protein
MDTNEHESEGLAQKLGLIRKVNVARQFSFVFIGVYSSFGFSSAGFRLNSNAPAKSRALPKPVDATA